MEMDDATIRQAMRRLLDVEREHIYGEKSGSASNRKARIERELDKVLEELRAPRP